MQVGKFRKMLKKSDPKSEVALILCDDNGFRLARISDKYPGNEGTGLITIPVDAQEYPHIPWKDAMSGVI